MRCTVHVACVREQHERLQYRYSTMAADISLETLRLQSSINGTDATQLIRTLAPTQIIATQSQPNELFIRLVTIRIWIFNFVLNRWRNEAICNNFLPFPVERKFPINFVITLSFCTYSIYLFERELWREWEGKNARLQSPFRQTKFVPAIGFPMQDSHHINL